MIRRRAAEQRGTANFDWLTSKHTFSFGHYYDPAHMGFGPLRVINEDVVQSGRGFATHGHKDMEIISVVLDGELEHKDSLGTGSIIRPGDVQCMTAGTGVRHSEFNHSQSSLVHFLQIWILPEQSNLPPGYEQKSFDLEQSEGRLRLIASRSGREGSITIHQDVDVYAARMAAGEVLEQALDIARIGWLQIARGNVDVNGTTLHEGDGAAISEERVVSLQALSPSEFLFFDMARRS